MKQGQLVGQNLGQSQQLKLTPSVQQSLRILQISALELHEEIIQALEENPFLERDDLGLENEGNYVVGEDWEEAGATTLQMHLRSQMANMRLNAEERSALFDLIDSLDDDGYLRDEVPDSHAHHLALQFLQSMQPKGVGARNLAECLGLQLRDLPDGQFQIPTNPSGGLPTNDFPNHILRDVAIQLCKDDLGLLAKREYRQIAEHLKCDEAMVRAAHAIILKLNPKPGLEFATINPVSRIPELGVEEEDGQWHAVLLGSVGIRVNQTYTQLFKTHVGKHEVLQQHLQEARWLLNAIEQRYATLLAVAKALISRQQGFFKSGDTALKPLTLAEIAEKIQMHESTISRAITGKYIATPRGVVELKHFFSSAIRGVDDDISSHAVRAKLREIIATEPASKPLSDQKIADLLQATGIDCARRTVTKYREAMRIPAASQRKPLI